MKLLRGLDNFSDCVKGLVATIGNFDGVHLGHQALLSRLRAKADALQLPMLVLLFEPQPAEYFQAQQAPARLTSLREKLAMLNHCKVDYVYCLPFNKSLALMLAEDFARDYFFSLQIRYLLVGEDFRFGKGRAGDLCLLKTLAPQKGVTVDAFPNFSLDNYRVSSTTVREALAKGQLEKAAQLLGRTFSLCGRVIKGDGQARRWGFPTANLSIKRLTLPLKGVFCVQVRRAKGDWLQGVANLGCRPTIDGRKNSLEVHLFDFEESLYGEWLEVFFLHKLRDEIRFSSVDALIRQIQNDITAAKAFWTQGYRVG